MIELQNLYICLVEPSNLQANFITRDLNGLDVTQVGRVKNGEEAIATLEGDTPPDVVMSAMHLPDMTGTDLLTTIRQQSSHPETPFVLVSSETDPRNLEGVRQAGVIAILPKPYTKVQLLRALKNALDFLNADEEREEKDDLKLSNLRVLIVDDSKIARKHIRSILERIGFEDFTEAADGLEAIPLVENVLFDLVVTDYNMPNMDGLGLVDFIRNKSIQSSVPILLVSSLEDEERLAALMDVGVSAVFSKPFEINSVRKLIKQLFGEENI